MIAPAGFLNEFPLDRFNLRAFILVVPAFQG